MDNSLVMTSVLAKDSKLDESLKERLLAKQENSARYNQMLEFRKKLPSFQMRHDILQMVRENQVILISGETGCGKTTQVAQFILDDYILRGEGSTCHVVCTQPRRISATSVAERVASERDEVCGADSTGYQIRLEAKICRKKGSILFCTTGILLQWMRSDPALREVSHLVLDEIHERDVTSDFVITILKDIIPKRPNLKVILMSATLNAEQFSKYYDNCPSINIPGFTYPVEEFYLEDVLHLTKHLQSQKKYSSRVLECLKNPNSEDICLELVEALLHHICSTKEYGAILVFLPGWADISSLHSIITDCGRYPSSRYIVIPLHSMMPTTTQKSVFDRPPHGVRKIVLATNIAETSITIDDVVYVVDCGKIKMKNFDVENNIATLKSEWVSLANARQRKGRAGRVQPGVCYHLYTRAREMTLENYPLPEMLRSRLEEVILQLKILQLGQAEPFLQRVMDPPDPRVLEISLKLLHTLNALDSDENLTPLGYHLANLPLDPQTGKMILMGAMFSCIDPIFSVAASLTFKDPFVIPLGKEDQVNKCKIELSNGSKSDHLVIAEAVKLWERAKNHGHSRDFCWDYFLSQNTMNLLKDMKEQFARYLYDMNFLSEQDVKAPTANVNSNNLSLVKAIICAGLYPNIAIIKTCLCEASIRCLQSTKDGLNHYNSQCNTVLFMKNFFKKGCGAHKLYLARLEEEKRIEAEQKKQEQEDKGKIKNQNEEFQTNRKVLGTKSQEAKEATQKENLLEKQESEAKEEFQSYNKSVKRRNHTGKVIIRLSTPEDGRVELHPKSINEKMLDFESRFLLYHLKLKSTAIFLHDTTMVYPLPLLFFGEGVDYYEENGTEFIAVNNSIRFRCRKSTSSLVKDLRNRLDGLLEHKVTHPGVIDWSRTSEEGALLRAIIELITYEDKQLMIAQEGDDDNFSN
uniref:RNA helicase n=1 Tax=Timema genevievae TaxID=629358 RepID=A0A7R9JUC9_TIMGE|nr:unnamed protein product [Timema genevievae]